MIVKLPEYVHITDFSLFNVEEHGVYTCLAVNSKGNLDISNITTLNITGIAEGDSNIPVLSINSKTLTYNNLFDIEYNLGRSALFYKKENYATDKFSLEGLSDNIINDSDKKHYQINYKLFANGGSSLQDSSKYSLVHFESTTHYDLTESSYASSSNSAVIEAKGYYNSVSNKPVTYSKIGVYPYNYSYQNSYAEVTAQSIRNGYNNISYSVRITAPEIQFDLNYYNNESPSLIYKREVVEGYLTPCLYLNSSISSLTFGKPDKNIKTIYVDTVKVNNLELAGTPLSPGTPIVSPYVATIDVDPYTQRSGSGGTGDYNGSSFLGNVSTGFFANSSDHIVTHSDSEYRDLRSIFPRILAGLANDDGTGTTKVRNSIGRICLCKYNGDDFPNGRDARQLETSPTICYDYDPEGSPTIVNGNLLKPVCITFDQDNGKLDLETGIEVLTGEWMILSYIKTFQNSNKVPIVLAVKVFPDSSYNP